MQVQVTKITRIAPGENATAWRDALGNDAWPTTSRILKEDGGSWVRRTTLMGREVVVKCRSLDTLWKRFKVAAGLGHAHKQWRGAERLTKAGIATGCPLLAAHARIDGRPFEVLVLEYVEGKTLLEVLDEIGRGTGPGVKDQHAIARALGTQIREMLDRYCPNRDHKPSNLVVRRTDRGDWQIAVIDCVGIGGRLYGLPHVDDSDWADMLTTPIIEPIGCGCPPRRSLWLRTLLATGIADPAKTRKAKRRDLGSTIRLIDELVRAHGDARPRVNPLHRPPPE